MRWGRQARADSVASCGELMEGMPGVGEVKSVYRTYRCVSAVWLTRLIEYGMVRGIAVYDCAVLQVV